MKPVCLLLLPEQESTARKMVDMYAQSKAPSMVASRRFSVLESAGIKSLTQNKQLALDILLCRLWSSKSSKGMQDFCNGVLNKCKLPGSDVLLCKKVFAPTVMYKSVSVNSGVMATIKLALQPHQCQHKVHANLWALVQRPQAS